MKLLIAFVFSSISLVLASKCGIKNKAIDDDFDRIVGGIDAQHGEFPWQISLQAESWYGSYHYCGGSILDENWVVTAAHCVDGFFPSELKVLAGEHNLQTDDGTEQFIQVEDIIAHENYDYHQLKNDIALLKLSSSLDLSSKFSGAICLPSYDRQEYKGHCIVTGWGALREGGSSPNILQKVSVPMLTDEECSRSYDIADSMVCAGYPEGGKDACQGDSGGPLVCPNRDGSYALAGIVSWGNGCAQPGYPGVYTEVSHFLDWIERNKY